MHTTMQSLIMITQWSQGVVEFWKFPVAVGTPVPLAGTVKFTVPVILYPPWVGLEIGCGFVLVILVTLVTGAFGLAGIAGGGTTVEFVY